MKNTILDFFGFSQIPFSKTLLPKQLFHSQDFKEAFAPLTNVCSHVSRPHHPLNQTRRLTPQTAP